MSIGLLNGPLLTNFALFENTEDSEQDLGSITWPNPTEENDVWTVVIVGVDVAGATIEETPVIITEAEAFSPAKVFRALARLIKETLCPDCSDGY